MAITIIGKRQRHNQAQSNIKDETFCKSSKWFAAFNYFCKKLRLMFGCVLNAPLTMHLFLSWANIAIKILTLPKQSFSKASFQRIKKLRIETFETFFEFYRWSFEGAKPHILMSWIYREAAATSKFQIRFSESVSPAHNYWNHNLY